MTAGPPPAFDSAVRALKLSESHPLIVCDADEVLVQFVAGLERYLESEGLWLDLQSFALTGNIKEQAGGRVLAQAEVSGVLEGFYETQTDQLETVAGAAEALGALSVHCQVVVLSNLPEVARAAREDWLARHGMAFPVIANAGLKGAALKALADRTGRPVFFLDDIPHHIADAARRVPESHRIHFVADARLSRLLPPAEACHLRTSDWGEARAFMEERLTP